jgi:hypothetical protein
MESGTDPAGAYDVGKFAAQQWLLMELLFFLSTVSVVVTRIVPLVVPTMVRIH